MSDKSFGRSRPEATHRETTSRDGSHEASPRVKASRVPNATLSGPDHPASPHQIDGRLVFIVVFHRRPQNGRRRRPSSELRRSEKGFGDLQPMCDTNVPTSNAPFSRHKLHPACGCSGSGRKSCNMQKQIRSFASIRARHNGQISAIVAGLSRTDGFDDRLDVWLYSNDDASVHCFSLIRIVRRLQGVCPPSRWP